MGACFKNGCNDMMTKSGKFSEGNMKGKCREEYERPERFDLARPWHSELLVCAKDRQTLQISLIPSCGSVSVIPMKIAEQRIGRQEREDKSQFPSSSKDLETVISDAGWQTIRCP